MVKRKVIRIDEARCTGCGECIRACAEGAIELKNGRARVVSDKFCDGLGACLTVCPEGALTIEEREADEFDLKSRGERKEAPRAPCSAAFSMIPKEEAALSAREAKQPSMLRNWPIQMRLAHPGASCFKGASLLIAADCTGFAYPAIHRDFIRGRVTIVGCPKLDDQKQFVDNLADILKNNEIKEITVLQMTVPCCSQITRLVSSAVKKSGREVPIASHNVGIRGEA
jgi:NAD-dependent dihydropyrimidine dehydrogenase PreA subunit